MLRGQFIVGGVFCSSLSEQEAGHAMDVIGMQKIQLLIGEHAAKCMEVCFLLMVCLHFNAESLFYVI